MTELLHGSHDDDQSEFDLYVDAGVPMDRMLTDDEMDYVYRELK